MRDAGGSPLGKALLRLPKVTSVFFGTDFITVNKEEEADWDALRTLVLHTIMEKYDAEEPVYTEAVLAEDTAPCADDSEIVAAIKEVIDLRIRPAVQDDGGDVFFQYVLSGMQCTGTCPMRCGSHDVCACCLVPTARLMKTLVKCCYAWLAAVLAAHPVL